MCQHSDDLREIRDALIRYDGRLANIEEKLTKQNGRVSKNEEAIQQMRHDNAKLYTKLDNWFQRFEEHKMEVKESPDNKVSIKTLAIISIITLLVGVFITAAGVEVSQILEAVDTIS